MKAVALAVPVTVTVMMLASVLEAVAFGGRVGGHRHRSRGEGERGDCRGQDLGHGSSPGSCRATVALRWCHARRPLLHGAVLAITGIRIRSPVAQTCGCVPGRYRER